MRRPGTRSAAGGRRNRGPHPITIALVAIAIVLFITYYAFAQQIPFVSHPFRLHALVTNSVAVRADSPVRIAGIDVGTVQGVSPAGRSSSIELTVDGNGLPIHRDATITIRDRLFLEGGYYLELDPGSPSAPTLNSGETIPQSQTRTPVQFYQVLSTLNAPARTSLENLLNTLNDSLSSIDSHGNPVPRPGVFGLKRTIPLLTPVLKDVALISRGLRGTGPGDVQTLLSSASDVTTTLQQSSPQLADLLTSLNRVAGALASTDGSLAQSISALDQTLRVAPSSLSAVDRALSPVGQLGAALDPSLKLAPPLLDGLNRAVTELAAVVAPGERDRLLTALKAAFQQFPFLVTQLGTVFPVTKNVTDCLQSHVTPVLTSAVKDGALSSGRPVWQDFVHALVGLAGQGSNFDANGHWDRFTEGVGTNTLAGLGTLPLVGQLVGDVPSAGSNLQGARPAWVGDLTNDVYQPGVPCTTQATPNLTAVTAAPDLRSAGSGPPVSQSTVSSLVRTLQRALTQAGGR